MSDYPPSSVLDFKFCTILNAVPTTLSGTPVISVYKDNSTTQSTAGITLSVDFDGVTGLNQVRVDTSADGTFYSPGSSFQIVVTTGTVGGNSLIGFVVDNFTLYRESALRPTIAGRTLDVSTGGEAGLDWANVGSPTTTLVLSGTTVATVTNQVTANALQWGGVNVTGMPMPTYTQPSGFLAATFPLSVASPTNITAGTITTVTNLTNAPTAGDFTSTMKASITTAVPTAIAIADSTLTRDWTLVSSPASRSLLQMGRFIRNGFTISGSTLSVLAEDDSTVAYTRTLATDPTATPIVGVT